MTSTRKTRSNAQLLLLVLATGCAGQTPAPTIGSTPASGPVQALANEAVSVTMTSADRSKLLSGQTGATFGTGSGTADVTINVDENTSYQTIQGFGASFNGATVYNVQQRMNATQRQAWIDAFFSSSGLGLNILRQPVGGSDLDANGQPGTYDDNGGTADPNLTNFSIAWDVNNGVISLIKQAQTANSNVKILGSVWKIPAWMKQSSGGYNNASVLSSTYYGTFANYLAKWVAAYAAQGVTNIWAVNSVNEPLGSYANFGNNQTGPIERDLVKGYVGPTFANSSNTAVKNTKIFVYDHNWDAPDYPRTILQDATANSYTSGVSWHFYAGSPDVMTQLHNDYPSKQMIYSEDSSPRDNTTASDYIWREKSHVPIRALRNWAETYIKWTAALDENYGPSQCGSCGALSYVNSTTGNVTYAVEYYMLGQFSKFVKPGAKRVASTDTNPESTSYNSLTSYSVDNVAFKNPDGSKVLVVSNTNTTSKSVKVTWGTQNFTYTLPAQTMATFTWSGTQTGGSGPQLVDNTSAAVTYSGTWNSSTGLATSTWTNGTSSYSNASGAYAQYTCSSCTEIMWQATKSNDSGIANVYVDGTLVGTLDMYAGSREASRVRFSTGLLSSGSHTLKVEVSGSKNASSANNWLEVDAFQYASGGTYVDNTSTAVTYSGTWNSSTGLATSTWANGTSSYSNASGAYAQYTCSSCTEILWDATRSNDSGIANVYVDGTLVGTVDMYASARQGTRGRFGTGLLSSGSHTLKVQVSGSKNASSANNWLEVDAFHAY
ncbi:glycoside hydrolase family 30 protein [Deinococcus pimensis]|uniref:glycoside hydrolase family 30 protein n=1 Tax=Deinococcus pimensis TaxID=309888 RepID=UPI0006942567|nr:glycoside hydrolase family 30 beta sandwich domain-containing protein [Deinococcus pimensis]